jgi:hypothetical protein
MIARRTLLCNACNGTATQQRAITNLAGSVKLEQTSIGLRSQDCYGASEESPCRIQDRYARPDVLFSGGFFFYIFWGARGAALAHTSSLSLSKSLIWVVRCPRLVPRGHRFGKKPIPPQRWIIDARDVARGPSADAAAHAAPDAPRGDADEAAGARRAVAAGLRRGGAALILIDD